MTDDVRDGDDQQRAETERARAEKREAERRRDGRRVSERQGDSVRAAIREELSTSETPPTSQRAIAREERANATPIIETAFGVMPWRASNRAMTIGPTRLIAKSGGASGAFLADPGLEPASDGALPATATSPGVER